MDYPNVDLNLLQYLAVLMEERNVTRAAARLGVTQPAVSAALARLRAILGDQLLVRTPGGMVPTPRALDIAEHLQPLTESIRRILQPDDAFEPTASKRVFTIVGSDFVEWLMLPRLISAVREEAPHVEVAFRPPDPLHLEERMADGKLDLAIGYLPEPPPGLMRTAVLSEPFRCLARRDHPALRRRGRMPLEAFTQLGHVQVLPRDAAVYGAPIDAALAKLDLVRHVVLWLPSFLAVPHVVAETDLVATVPAKLARAYAALLPLQHLDPPLPLPTVDIAVYWHPRAADDAGLKWLRRLVLRLFRAGRAAA